jgi:quercetin dioxygenase-like cupin family protein
MSCALGLAASSAGTAQAAANHATTIHRQALPPPFDGWEAEFVAVTMEPGPGFAPLRHPGFVLGYVIDGEFRFGLEGEAERVLSAGSAFYEPPGSHHRVSASSSATHSTRILAIIISKPAAGSSPQ